MRSRTVSRPWSRCRLTLSTPPISRANASRRASSSSSGFQFIASSVLMILLLLLCAGTGSVFPLHPIAEDIAVGAFQEVADRDAQFQQPWRDFLVQALLVKHRRQQTDRDHHKSLIL